MRTLDATRPGTAAGAVGVAQAAYELAVEYAKERVTFDVPIAMHQGVNFMIADMATEIEAARLLTWQAAWLLDQGKRATLHSSFAKRFAADTAMKVTTDAVQVFGGYGYIKEYPVEKLMRDAKLFQIYEGTSQIQRLVIAKEIFLPRSESLARFAFRSGLAPAALALEAAGERCFGHGRAVRRSRTWRSERLARGARDRPLRPRRARHRRVARARPRRRADARARRRGRRDRRHPARVGLRARTPSATAHSPRRRARREWSTPRRPSTRSASSAGARSRSSAT